MGLVDTTCGGCGKKVWGIISSLRKVGDRYLCENCAKNPDANPELYCNSCHNYSAYAKMKGNGWIELILYLFYIIPGVIYSIWRRSDKPNVCPLCNSPGLIPANMAKAPEEPSTARDEAECPFCAEKILAKAKVCKHCGKEVRL